MARKPVFECSLCESTFHREQDLKRHRTLFHSKKKINEDDAEPERPSLAYQVDQVESALAGQIETADEPLDLVQALLLLNRLSILVKERLKQIL